MTDKKTDKKNDVQIPLAEKEYTIPAEEMSLILNMITIVARRGAFQPAEFQVIGAFFEKYAPKAPDEPEKESKEKDIADP
mgnify:CR=1 FL=1|jgi:hypothetical protein